MRQFGEKFLSISYIIGGTAEIEFPMFYTQLRQVFKGQKLLSSFNISLLIERLDGNFKI